MLVRFISTDINEQSHTSRLFLFPLAKSGDRSNHMPYQAQLLLQRMKNEHLCDWNNDWKVITLFIGVRKTFQILMI